MRSGPKLSTRGLARLIEQVGKAAYNLGYTPGLNPAQWAALRYFERSHVGEAHGYRLFSVPGHNKRHGFANSGRDSP